MESNIRFLEVYSGLNTKQIYNLKIECSQQQNGSVKAPDHTGNGCGVEVSGDCDFVYQGEKIKLEMKKQAEQDLCLKCYEGDQLLICDANVW